MKVNQLFKKLIPGFYPEITLTIKKIYFQLFHNIFYRNINYSQKDMAQNNNTNSPQGLRCPECQNIIPVTIEMLVQRQTFKCQNCNLELEIDEEASTSVLESLEKVYEAQQEVKRVQHSL